MFFSSLLLHLCGYLDFGLRSLVYSIKKTIAVVFCSCFHLCLLSCCVVSFNEYNHHCSCFHSTSFKTLVPSYYCINIISLSLSPSIKQTLKNVLESQPVPFRNNF